MGRPGGHQGRKQGGIAPFPGIPGPLLGLAVTPFQPALNAFLKGIARLFPGPAQTKFAYLARQGIGQGQAPEHQVSGQEQKSQGHQHQIQGHFHPPGGQHHQHIAPVALGCQGQPGGQGEEEDEPGKAFHLPASLPSLTLRTAPKLSLRSGSLIIRSVPASWRTVLRALATPGSWVLK